MQSIEKQQILKYFKNCIVEDSKEELSIELDLEKSNAKKLFVPDLDNDIIYDKAFTYTSDNLNNFYSTLSKEWIWNKESWLTINNIDSLDYWKREYFLEKCFVDYKKNKSWDKKNNSRKDIITLIDFIKWDNNALRQKTIKQINNYIYYVNSDKEYLKWADLANLFYAWDKKEEIDKIDFFWNDNFLDFYDNNKKEKLYLCLENVITEKNKKIIFQPLYFIEVEIEEDTKEHFFTLSLAETNPSFNFYVEHFNSWSWKRTKFFKIEWKQEKEEWFELEKEIDWLVNFESKIALYKSKINNTVDKSIIKKTTCLISANDIWFIKNLIKEYNSLIDDKDLSKISNTWLWFLFNENRRKELYIDKFTTSSLLNSEQEIAVKESLWNNLSVVVWPPWTWKSQVVVNILLNAYINDKTVLFASKNNTAVDTVLNKISNLNLTHYPFLRLGSKKSQDEWWPKILNNLKLNNRANKIDYSIISDLLEKIEDFNSAIKNIEDLYLKYYESYEELELILNWYPDELKSYFLKIKRIDIDFGKIEEFNNDYDKLNNYYDLLLNKIWKKETLIKEFIEKDSSLKKMVSNLNKLWDEYEIDFKSIKVDIKDKSNSLKKKKQEFTKNEKIFSDLMNKNDYSRYLNKISNKLKSLVLKKQFINYNNLKISSLKGILDDIEDVSDYWFLKTIFWFKNKKVKEFRRLFYDIIENQENEKLEKYFFDFSEDLSDNEELKEKIKEIISLKWFEQKYIEYHKNEKEYKKILKIKDGIIAELENDYNDSLKNIEKVFLTNFLDLSFNSINNKLDNINELFIINNKLNWLNSELYNTTIKKEKLGVNIIDYINKFIPDDIYKFIFWKKIDKKFNDSIYVKFKSLLGLKSINIQKEYIKNNFNILNNLSYDVTSLNKKILDTQEILKNKSLDYLSYEIFDNINAIKPKLTDSIDKIYNMWDYVREWWDSKDSYLIEKFSIIFEWIKIFITTNLSTSSLPLKEWFFDYLIIDEASQNDIASVIPLLYRVKNVIIIWDPNQLQNIIKLNNDSIWKIFDWTLKKANLKWIDYIEDFKDIYNFKNSIFSTFESIFKSKMNKNILTLKEHYRCQDDIINYSNYIIDDYELFPRLYQKNENLNNTWISLWIHWQEDIKSDDSEDTKINIWEANAIIKYLIEIIWVLWEKVSIWVIAPFRNQVNYINKLLRDNWLEKYKNILVDTVHKFQWDEKDIILFSTVFPNAKASSFLNDVNLLNVAVSRARNSFLIFWDRAAITKARDENWEKLLYTTLIDYIDSVNKWKNIVESKKYDTKFEKMFFEELEKANIVFDYQYPINNWRYDLDFRIKLKWFNSYLNLELDWWVHDKQKSYDYTRNRQVEKLWYKVVRYSNTYMLENMWEIIDGLKKICEIKD